GHGRDCRDHPGRDLPAHVQHGRRGALMSRALRVSGRARLLPSRGHERARGSARASPSHTGMTLLELAVVITVIGILVAFVIPSFNRVAEQSRLDAASQYLRSIWPAQRVYWLENRTFTDSLTPLGDMKLLDPRIRGVRD